jgi:hypothetical protein
MQQRRQSFVLPALVPALVLTLVAGCDKKGDVARRDETAFANVGSGVTSAPAAAPAPQAPGNVVTRSARRSSPVAEMAGSVPAQAVSPGSMLIRSATVSVEVKSLDSAVAEARRIAQRNGAIIANVSLATGRNEVHRGVLQLRVPADRFDALLGGLDPLGRRESVAVNAQDVGEEYVDVEARLANLRRLEARIVELLANRTGKLADVLSVENELSRVRGEIEQAEGRQRYLKQSVALSTVELTLHEPEPIIAGRPGSNPIGVAVRHAWRNFVASVAWCITALGVLVPGTVFVLLLAITGRWVKRRLERAGLLGGLGATSG